MADTTTTGRQRIVELDAIRGFALCGIHVVNVYQQVVFPAVFGDQRGLGLAVMPAVVRYGFYERFLPIFTLLFGVGFAIFLASAGNRTDRPRVVLARRLGVLAVLGLLHQLVHPGEVLLPYAVFGLLFLLPASFLRPWWALALGLVLLVVGGQTVAGFGVMPGLWAVSRIYRENQGVIDQLANSHATVIFSDHAAPSRSYTRAKVLDAAGFALGEQLLAGPDRSDEAL